MMFLVEISNGRSSRLPRLEGIGGSRNLSASSSLEVMLVLFHQISWSIIE